MAVTPRERREGRYVKNAAGIYVPEEPISATLVAAAATNDIPRVKADDTLEFAALTAGTDITITHGAGTITIASTASGGGGATVLYDSGELASPANAIDTGAAGIAGGHDLIEIWAVLRTDEAVARSNVSMRLNNDTGNNYDYQRVSGVNAAASANIVLASSSWLASCPGANCAAGVFGTSRTTFPFYAGTTAQKTGENTHGNADTTAANCAASLYLLNWRSTAAITRFSVTAPATKNFIAGSRLIIYGR